jgi:predicted Zn-dependent peptidase
LTPSSYEIESTVLPNGVRIISERMPQVRSVSAGVWVTVGSRREPADQNGICHFIEHMLFKGTHHRSAEQIAREVDSIGGNLDAFTARELVSFNIKVLDEHLPVAFDVLSDLVLHPLFKEEDIEKEKGVILEEIKMDADNPEYVTHELFCGNFWRDQAIGRPILGTRHTIRHFQREAIEHFYRRAYDPSSLLITAAGNLDHGNLVRLVERDFARLEGVGVLPPPAAAQTFAPITLKSKKSLEQLHLCVGVPCHPMPHPMRYACYVLNTILGGGMSSRLFQNVREKLGLAYAIFSELNMYHDTGCIAIYAGTSSENARRVIDSILAEFRSLKESEAPPEELRRAKDHLKGSLVLGLESTSSRMGNLARQQIFLDRFHTLDESLQSIEMVSAGDVRELALEFLQTGKIAITMLGNLDDIRIERQDLAC